MLTPLSTAMRALTFKANDASNTLVSRIARGEPSAIGEVYDLHHEAVRAFAARLLGDESAAEDLVHEVFVALPKAIAGFRHDSSLRTFLTGVAVNHARHHIRATARRRAAMARAAQNPSDAAAVSLCPQNAAENRATVEAIARALDLLTEDQRIAFVLCEVEERTSKEAAALIGAKEATIRTRLHHARKRMRDALEQEGVR